MKNSALIVVDMINDFMEHGPLPVPGVADIIPNINKLIRYADDHGWLVVYARDYHPANSSHFNKWVPHAIAETKGAGLDFRVILPFRNPAVVINKGTQAYEDGYSAFSGVVQFPLDDADTLTQVLRKHNVVNVFVCGVATEYCVLETALDSVKHSFATYLVEGTHAGINGDDIELAKALLEKRGIRTNVQMKDLPA